VTSSPATPARRPRATGRLGRLGPLDRANALCDPGTFTAHTLEPGSAVVLGFGMVSAQPAAVIAHDLAVARGATSARDARRMAALVDDARERGAAVFVLCDSEGGRLAEGPATISDNAAFLRALADASGRVPLFAAVFGLAGGAAAYAAALCDLVVAVRHRSFAFLSGPSVVEAALGESPSLETLGGTALHAEDTGLYTATADDDRAALDQLRAFAALLPAAAWRPTPRAPPLPPARTDVPIAPRGDPHDARALIDALVDADSFAPLHDEWGPASLTGLARIDGAPVAIVASQPLVLAGAIDTSAAMKIARIVRLATAFGLPIVTLADTPGFLPGRAAEVARILAHGARVISAYTEARHHVATVSVIIRRAVGGGVVLAASAATVLAFPDAEIVQMGQRARDAVDGPSPASDTAPDTPTPAPPTFVHRVIPPASLRHEVALALALSRPPSPTSPGGRRTVLLPI
jgi:acetyl-CoA carboxylase carboxyltransferase component